MHTRYLSAASAASLVMLASLAALAEPKLTLTVPGYSWTDELRGSETALAVPTFHDPLSITVGIDKHEVVCAPNGKKSTTWPDGTLECDLSREPPSVSWRVGSDSGKVVLEARPITTRFSLDASCTPIQPTPYVTQDQLDGKTIRGCYLDGTTVVANLPAAVTLDPLKPGLATIDMRPSGLGLGGRGWQVDEGHPWSNQPTWRALYYPLPSEAPSLQMAILASAIDPKAEFIAKMCFQTPRGWGDSSDFADFELSIQLRGSRRVLKPNTDITWETRFENGARSYCARAVGSGLEKLTDELKEMIREGNSPEFSLTYKAAPIQRFVLKDETVKAVLGGFLMHQGRRVERVVRDRPLMKWANKLCLVPASRPAVGPIRVDVSRLSIAHETELRVTTFKGKVVAFYPSQDGSGAYCAAFATGTDAGPGSLEIQTSAESVRESLYLFWDDTRLEEPLATLENPYWITPGDVASEAYISAGVYSPIRGSARAPEAAYWLRGNAPLLGGVGAIQDVFRVSGDLGVAPGLVGAGAEDGTVAGVSVSAYGAFCLRIETSLTPGACVTLSGDAMGLNTPTGLDGALQVSYGFFISGSLK